jgi:hypothetical protein
MNHNQSATAVGLRAHSGWAALVAVAGTPRSPEILLRRRVELADPRVPGSKQPYHAAEGEKLPKAKKIVSRCAGDARRLAGRAFDEVLAELKKSKHPVIACGLLLASGRPLPALEAILASHALIHTADGELFRDALAAAAQERGLPVTRVREKEISSIAAAGLRIPEEEIARCLKDAGRSIGPPWTQDQKLAVLAAWVAVAPRLRGICA